jgi:ABC-type thiamine transport system ATPase subunit
MENLELDEKSRKLIDSLRDVVGNQIELPEIAVIGDTSSGKSSLLSTISTFEFPSSNELCTRCPIQLSLNPSEKTEIEISLKNKIGETIKYEKINNK